MKRQRKLLPLLLVALMVSLWSAFPSFANSAEPPGLTILVTAPPADLEVTMRFPEGEVELERVNKGWEAYYRFYYHSIAAPQRADLDDAQLVARSGGEEMTCDLPSETFSTYSNLVTLDWGDRVVVVGQPVWRTYLLVALRVTLTLLIEGVIFYLMGYRERYSWTLFLLVNLVTQGGLNLMITGPDLGSYWFLGFALGEIVILIVETVFFVTKLTERKRSRAALHALLANGLSLFVGGWLISTLPV